MIQAAVNFRTTRLATPIFYIISIAQVVRVMAMDQDFRDSVRVRLSNIRVGYGQA